MYILGCIASVPLPCNSAKVGQEQFGQHKMEARAKRAPLLNGDSVLNCKHVHLLDLPLESELCLEVRPSASSLGGNYPAIPLSLESKLVFL